MRHEEGSKTNNRCFRLSSWVLGVAIERGASVGGGVDVLTSGCPLDVQLKVARVWSWKCEFGSFQPQKRVRKVFRLG